MLSSYFIPKMTSSHHRMNNLILSALYQRVRVSVSRKFYLRLRNFYVRAVRQIVPALDCFKLLLNRRSIILVLAEN